MDSLIEKIARSVERGKVDRVCPYPPDMAGQEGTAELVEEALRSGIAPSRILSEGLIAAMSRIGERFRNNEIFLPEVLMSAQAMKAAMGKLKNSFQTGTLSHRGTIVLGTVAGDLHDIGKNIAGMFFEGGGWKVVDLGTDVNTQKFLQAIRENRPDAVGLSALLTTTMMSMAETVGAIIRDFPALRVIVGGAPLTAEFANQIGANGYFPDPQSALDFLEIRAG